MNYALSECSKLTQKDYKRRHYWFGTEIHWEICEMPDRRERPQTGGSNGKR